MNFKICFLSLFFILFFSGRLLASESPLEKGRRAYMSNCISCHNKDPNLKGAIGPEVVGVPLEVFESKVLTGKYPEKLPIGFKPRRTTKLMRPLTKLKDNVKDMHAWIESINKTKK